MPNIRMLTAQRELAEKERMKFQGLQKAQRNQESDTQDVAKKTNTSEAARAFKKAQSDMRTAKDEEKLAQTKAGYAAIGAAIGAIGGIVSMALAVGKMVKESKEADKKPPEPPKEAKSATQTNNSSKPATKTENGSKSVKTDDSKKVAETKEIVKTKEEEKPKPGQEKVKDTKETEQKNPEAKVKKESTDPNDKKVEKETKPTEKMKDENSDVKTLSDDKKTDPIKAETEKQVDPNAQKLETETSPTKKMETENSDVKNLSDEKKTDPIKKETENKVDPNEQKIEKQTNPTEVKKEENVNPEERSKFEKFMDKALSSEPKTDAEKRKSAAQADATYQLIKGITALGGYKQDEMTDKWKMGGSGDVFGAAKNLGKTLGENVGAAFKGRDAVDALGDQRALAASRTQLLDQVAGSKGQDGKRTGGVKGETDRIDKEAKLIAQFEKDGTKGMDDAQKESLQKLGVIDASGKTISGGVDAAKSSLAGQLKAITGSDVAPGSLVEVAASAKQDVDRMANALENNDLAEFRNIADGHTTVDKLGLTLSKGDKSLLNEIQADPSKLSSLSSSDMNRLKELGVVGSDNKIIEGGINKAIDRDSKASGIARNEQTILESVNNFGSRHNSGVGIEKRAGIESGKGNESALRIQEADRAIAGAVNFNGGAIGNIQKQMNNNMNSNSIRGGGTEERRGVAGSLLQKLSGGSRQEKLNENINDVRKAQLMADPQMKTLFESGAVKLDKNGNLELTGKGEKLFESKGGDSKPTTSTDPKEQALANIQSKIDSDPVAKAQLIAKLDQNADGYSNGNAAKILKDMDPKQRKEFLSKEGVGGVLNQGAIIAGGIRNGTLSDREAKKMIMEANATVPSSPDNLSDPQKAMNSAKGAAIREAASLNGADRLLASIGGLTTDRKVNQTAIDQGINGRIDLIEQLKNPTEGSPEAKMSQGERDEKIQALTSDIGKLQNLSALNQVMGNTGSFDSKAYGNTDPNKGPVLDSDTKATIDTLINQGSNNLSARLAIKEDPELFGFNKDTGESLVTDKNGNFSQEKLNDLKAKDPEKYNKIMEKMNGKDDSKVLADPSLNPDRANALIEESKNNGSGAAQVMNQMATADPAAAARVFDKMSDEQKAALGSDFDRNKVGGNKTEKASNLNTYLMYMNMGMPAIQFMLQQLDKMREAQEQGDEAKKKKEAAQKLMNDIAKNLKRTQGDGSSGSMGGIQASGAGVGGAK